MAEHRARKPVYKWVSFWLLLLVVLYTIIGFLILPLVVEKQLPKQLETNLGWQASVADVNFNPYLMTLEVKDFKAKDSESRPVLRFKRLYTDLGFLNLFTGTIQLDDIILDKPFVRVDLLPDYGVNLARDWAQRHESNPEPEKDSGSPPSLYFDAITLNDGHVRFRDLSQKTEKTFDIEPLSINLKNLAMFGDVDKASDYKLNAAIGDQQIQWQGTLDAVPFKSQGTIKLNKISYSTIWHFAGPYAPYVLKNGQLTLSTDYQIDTGGKLVLKTSHGKLSIADMSARVADSDKPFLTVKNLDGSDIAFDLQAQKFSMTSVTADTLDARLKRDKNGLLNVIAPFQSADNPDADSGAQSGGQPDKTESAPDNAASSNSTASQKNSNGGFKWAIKQVSLKNSHLNWQDKTTDTPVNVDLNAINLETGPFSQALGKPVSYKLSFNTADQGKIAVNGQTTLQPFTLQSDMKLDQVGLNPFEPYVSQNINLLLRKGTLTVDGNLDIDALNPTFTGTFSGQAKIDDLDVTRPDADEALLAWKNVTVNPIKFNFDPMRLEIGTIAIQSPSSRFVRMKDGSTNFSNLTGSGESEKNSAADQSRQPTADAGKKADKSDAKESDFVFRINEISLKDGTVALTDRSVEPAFDDRLHDLHGSLKGLTNVPPQQAKLDLQGKIGDLGKLNFNGSVATVGGKDDTTTFNIQTSNVALPEISPYFANYLGYTIDNGKLKLDLKYTFTGTKINASNQVILDQLDLGEKVQSKEAVSIPVKLALSLLSNSNGVIDVTLPINGDLKDPSFSVTPVIMHTFLNVLAKAATSPFSVLGSVVDLAGFSAEELGEVAFVPGKAELADGEDDKLAVLAKALSEKKGVALKIRGSVNPEVDGAALRGQKLFRDLEIKATDPLDEIISTLESELVDRQGEQALKDLQAKAGMEKESRLQNADWLKKLTDTLTSGQSLAPGALSSLAKKRGSLLEKRLVEDYDIPGDQLYPLAPTKKGKTGMKNGKIRVIVPFSLDSK